MNYQAVLTKLGYTLIDYGDHWRTSANYRGGDNFTAIKIYKKTGVWVDFVANAGPFPFKKLIELSSDKLNRNELSELLHDAVENYSTSTFDASISMEKVYNPEMLDRLLPIYSFYLDRKISKKTLVHYRCGVAQSGQMYRRITFPIFNDHKQIVGFVGRKLFDDNNLPKWKIIGKKQNWVYPYYLSPDLYEQHSRAPLILIESIGDSLALHEKGVYNHLVSFGTSVSKSILKHIVSNSPSQIFIAFNNDEKSDINRGLVGAIKACADISLVYPMEKIFIALPPAKDFGDLLNHGGEFNDWLFPKTDSFIVDNLLNICKLVKDNKKHIKDKHLTIFKRVFKRQNISFSQQNKNIQ